MITNSKAVMFKGSAIIGETSSGLLITEADFSRYRQSLVDKGNSSIAIVKQSSKLK